MENNQYEFIKENKHLEQIIFMAQEKLDSAKDKLIKSKAKILLDKQELRDEKRHTLFDMYSLHGFHEIIELNQYAQPESGRLSEHEEEAEKIRSLEAMVDTPYFARVDFKFDDEAEAEKIYIGRSSLADSKFYEIYIYDWRSPIASVFYRFGIGKAYYQTPDGKITGEISLKRQYEIRHGKLEYFFDADIQIMDEFLRKLLSKNTSTKMKNIVETIQKDQDIIIRDIENELMMVQGIAGSGKTSIALHRAAYLMYRGFAKKLSYHNIIIISPNTLFERYISNVLPELGEKNVLSVTFEEMFSTILMLEDERIQTRNQYLEELILCNHTGLKKIKKASTAFKSSNQFLKILERYLYDLPRSHIEFSDLYYNGEIIITKQFIKAKLLIKKDTPLSIRLKQLEELILEKVRVLRKKRLKKLKEFVINHTNHKAEAEGYSRLLSIYESTILIKQIKRFTEINCIALYKKLFSEKKYFYRLAKGIDLPDCIEDILDYTNNNMNHVESHIKYDDVLPLSLFQIKACGFYEYRDIMQVVVDEAQDYYEMHFELLKTLFHRARYTVLGDINQTVEKEENISFYQTIQKVLQKDKSTLVTLDKSFRCTSDILLYSKRFLSKDFNMLSFSRSGDMPDIHGAQNSDDYFKKLISEIGICNEKGYQSIGLITKTEQDAVFIYEGLKEKTTIRLIKNDSIHDLTSTFIIPVYMSKGLEFDAVLVCGVDREHFSTAEDRKLLYVACTRALHRLNLFYMGEKSPFI